MAYQSVHTGPEVDAAVSVLSDVQDIRTEVAADKATVTTLAGQTATNAGLAQTAATNAQADAASALTSKNDAHTSAQTAGAHAANSDSARALAVVARNGAEEARDSAWEAEEEVRYLLGESEATIDSIRAEILRQKYGAGPYPSLDIGMVGANVLDRRVTFTRASDASYWDSLGALQTAGPNEPRFDYDPVTGESLGLLVEGQATNLVRWSEDLTQWGKTRLSVLNDSSVNNLRGDAGVSKLVEDSSLGTHYAEIGISSITAGQRYSFSFYAKRSERFKIGFLGIGGDRFTGDIRLGVDLENLTTFDATRVTGVRLTELPHGWVRIEGTVNEPALTTGAWGLRIYVLQDSATTVFNAHQGDGVSGLYAWGAQAEQGSFTTSYIKTEASQVTRASDLPIIEDLSWLNPGQGTFVLDIRAVTEGLLQIGVRGDLSRRQYLIFTGWNSIQWRNGANTSATLGSLTPGERGVMSMYYDAASQQYGGSLNGGPVSSVSQPLSDFSEFDVLYIGRGSAAFPGWRHVRRLTYYPRRFDDAKLEELSTP